MPGLPPLPSPHGQLCRRFPGLTTRRAAPRPLVAISIFISCKRERAIERAAKLRTMQRRPDAPAQEESKWRQMYSARMQVSVGLKAGQLENKPRCDIEVCGRRDVRGVGE